MRLKEGDELQLSDGTGLRIQAVVDDPKSGIVRVLGFTKEERPVVRLGLIQALPRMGTMSRRSIWPRRLGWTR